MLSVKVFPPFMCSCSMTWSEKCGADVLLSLGLGARGGGDTRRNNSWIVRSPGYRSRWRVLWSIQRSVMIMTHSPQSSVRHLLWSSPASRGSQWHWKVTLIIPSRSPLSFRPRLQLPAARPRCRRRHFQLPCLTWSSLSASATSIPDSAFIGPALPPDKAPQTSSLLPFPSGPRCVQCSPSSDPA